MKSNHPQQFESWWIKNPLIGSLSKAAKHFKKQRLDKAYNKYHYIFNELKKAEIEFQKNNINEKVASTKKENACQIPQTDLSSNQKLITKNEKPHYHKRKCDRNRSRRRQQTRVVPQKSYFQAMADCCLNYFPLLFGFAKTQPSSSSQELDRENASHTKPKIKKMI